MPNLRAIARLLRLALVLLFVLTMAGALGLAERAGLEPCARRRQRLSRVFMRRLAGVLPFQVQVIGELPRRPMLWVCNHVSWTDIPLLGMLVPLTFLSKAEVRHWPIAGWLAQQAGTLFIRRGGGDSQRLRQQIGEHLRQARPLLIFPEGTTTDGRRLRTFHGRLLAAAIDQRVAVQPVAIQYLRDGEVDTLAPFIGDDDLVSHLLRLFAQPPGEVVIHLLDPIASQDKERGLLALQAQQAIHGALFDGQELELARRQASVA
ncbi:1-acyl-sn-glycerol-3-phosphate acyltransferase [Pseudomonas capeferrum]|uniref:lysophospholipid acyltransferase family protein n=1 Tax=Pseudomonas capeferrum TaxID=1495066 RepID=UPI0015E44385|nr:lysophospholipid acyltransferase family protein [Pseudomonas capeferrum]MBA1202413.1 1-acyl-sn-glycerol-3-phosphate acyltransferase [Pseudomonas capeferrum]